MEPYPPEVQARFEHLLQLIHGERRHIQEVQAQPAGAQGASGALVHYFTATSTDPYGVVHQETLVTKAATLLERRVVQLLSSQGCAVPPVWIPDLTSAERAPIYMPYLEPRPPLDLGHPASPLTRSVADGLAQIHVANLQRPPAWLPHASSDFLGRLWLHAWREQWEANLAEPEFAQEFGAYTARLDATIARFMAALTALTAEDTTLTLLNVDSDPRRHSPVARFGVFHRLVPGRLSLLYLDLPNYFLIETALTYRDALRWHGFTIPVVEFLERYHGGEPLHGAALPRATRSGAGPKAGRSGVRDAGFCITRSAWRCMAVSGLPISTV